MSDCFIKLALAGETSTKGYRLLKISQPYGVSLDDIKHEAIVLHCDTTGIQRQVFESESVTVDLEFRDNEGDIIIVKTDLDLRNFSSSLPSSYIGKVFASVSNTVPAGTASTSKTTQTDTKVEEKNNDDQKIVDAIADIFSIAAVSMKAGITSAMTAKHLNSAVKDCSFKKEIQNAHKVSKDSLKAAKRIAKEHYKLLHLHRIPVLKHSGLVQSVASLSVPVEHNKEKNVTEQSKDSDTQAVMEGSNDEKAMKEGIKQENGVKGDCSVLPFIHGRHTCDQCLTTPIVGTRYHALNLPDYDLCAICYGNYQGSDIVFEEALLDRDVPYQERWNRKRAMLKGHLKHRPMPRSHFHRGCNNIRLSVKEAASATVIPEPVTTDTTLYAETSVSPVPNVPEDLALEEAIRRSLNDVAVLNQSDVKEISEEIEKVDVTTTESTSITVEPDIVVNTESINNEEISFKQDTSFATQAIGSGEVAEFVGETLDRLSEAIDELNSDVVDKGDLIFERDLVSQDAEYDSDDDDDDDSSGSKIVDGEEDAASTGSWSVAVDKEGAVVEDGGLGRAAEAIGSALFQSDMMRSVEETSAAVSSVTSVPTVTPSIDITEQIISPFQVQRWAIQLEQLHELGFSNDAACIDALESLSAANIGVDSNDEVTVQQVIQKLMGD